MGIHLRFFFDYGVDTPLWPTDVDSPYGYPCAPEDLPIAAGLSNELTRLADLYQSSLDWDDPAGPSPWTRDQWDSFQHAADTALESLHRELGDGWTVEDRRH